MWPQRLGATLLALAPAVLGVGVGLASAYWAVAAGPRLDVLSAGPWVAEPQAGTSEADPYELARRVRLESAVPLGIESLLFTAAADSEGRALEGRCDYRIEGNGPPARLWTLTVTDKAGATFATATKRSGLTSVEAVRLGPAEMLVAVSAQARPGNWIPVGDGLFVLRLRLYDTVVGSGFGATKLSLPEIVRGRCR